MGRSKKTTCKPLDPDDVLCGRIRPSARDLIALIHAVNPSGLGLAEREARRRYALKSRLQSLLVRTSPGDIAVVADADRPEVAVLQHTPSGLDACHTVVSELDEDARSLVRRLLDSHNDAQQAPAEFHSNRSRATPSDRSSEPDDLVARGQRALEEFDYDQARELLFQAVRETRDHCTAALALLQLLVDHLADDAAALELRFELSSEALRQSPIRLLISIAAARSGDRSTAIQLVEGTLNPRAAEVYAHLARHSLKVGELERARQDLDRCRELDSGHPDLEGLGRDLADARARVQTELAAQARALVNDQRDEEAWRVVKELLRASPNNPIGNALLTELQTRRAQVMCSELLQRAGIAEQGGDPATALSLVREASAYKMPDGESQRLARWATQLEAAVHAAEDNERVESVVSLLCDQPGEQAYGAYLDCRFELRSAVRARSASRVLGWLDELAQNRGPARNPAIASAVHALVSAERLVACNPRAAIDLLAPHTRLLANLNEYREVSARAEQGQSNLRAEQAQITLQQATREVENLDFEAAVVSLTDAMMEDLPETERSRARALRELARTELAAQRRIRALETRSKEPMPFDALAMSEELAKRAQGLELDRIHSIQRGIRGKIQRAFRFQSSFAEVPLGGTPEFVVGPRPQAWRCLLGDRNLLVVPVPRGNWLYVAVADLSRRVYTRRAILRLPESFSHGTFSTSDDELVLIGREGGVVRLSLDTLEPFSWGKLPLLPAVRSPDFVTSVRRVMRGGLQPVRVMFVAPGQRFLWVWEAEASPPRVRVIDLTTLRVVRDLPELVVDFDMRALPELEPAAVLVQKHLDSGRIWMGYYCPDGERLWEKDLDVAESMIGPHPESAGLVVLEPGGNAAAFGATPARWSIRDLLLDRTLFQMRDQESDFEPFFMITDRTQRMLFVVEATRSYGMALVALGLRPSGNLELLYRCPMPVQCMLCQPVVGGGVSALVARDDGLWPVEIHSAAPILPDSSIPPPARMLEHFGLDTPCDIPIGPLYNQSNAALSWMRSASPGQFESAVKSAFDRGDADTLMTYVVACKLGRANAKEGDLLRELRRDHSQHPWVRAAHAHVDATIGKWTELLQWADGIDPEELDEGVARHLYHLCALAHLHLGQPEQARGALAKARLYDGRCEFLWIEAVATPLDQELRALDGGKSAWPRDLLTVREVLRAVHQADECLERGDAKRAFILLDTVIVWQLLEVQSFARLAHAALLLDAQGYAEDSMRTALILTSFAHCHADQSLQHRKELPLPKGRWDMARLDALAARIEDWMQAKFP